MHARLEPANHTFVYPLYFYAFDLDELERLDAAIPLFGYNRIRPVAVHDIDYLERRPGSIREKLLIRLERAGIEAPGGRITLITAARYFNHVFNPVSFYYCHDSVGNLVCIVAEVNNTFGERHIYLLRDSAGPEERFHASFSAPKAFHVSPFNDMEGEYEFLFSDAGDTIDIRINLLREGRVVFRTRLRGCAVALTTGGLVRTMLRYPLTASLTMPRIVWQAALLKWRRKLRHYPKPVPASGDTFRVSPARRHERWAMNMIFKIFRQFTRGRLSIELPDGRICRFGDVGSGTDASMRVTDYRIFPRLLTGGDNAFGDGFVDGAWRSYDPASVLRVLADNKDVIARRSQRFSLLTRTLNRVAHFLRRNTLRGSRRNIFDHYDIGNDFFQVFLDPGMTYSCALFRSPEDGLYEAQRAKLKSIIDKAHLSPDDHVVEIGCGWGSFAIEAATLTGCRVTAVTISEEQRRFAEERVRSAGLADRITIKLCDYRDLEGQFDKLVSIEMLEAVGHEYFGRFFAACDRLLRPDGRAVIQVITIPDQRYERYRRRPDWIQMRIFPGGIVPSLGALLDAMRRHSSLTVEHAENIGPNYARTLKEWRKRLLAGIHQVRAMGFDERFIRTWEYYFSYCEAGFSSGLLGTHQIVLNRPVSRRLERTASASVADAGIQASAT